MAKKNKVKKVAKIYQLEIWLNGIKPRIWRKFAVESDIRLDKLHLVIQDVMGWTDTHLHQFSTRDMQYGAADPDFDMDDSEDERKFKLCDLVNRPREQFGYEYDFGDCWEHVVKLVAIEDAQENVEYPICLKGARACPPEDCGGCWGYEELLETIQGPDNEEKEEMLDWLGDEFKPDAFDLKTINRCLRSELKSDWA